MSCLPLVPVGRPGPGNLDLELLYKRLSRSAPPLPLQPDQTSLEKPGPARLLLSEGGLSTGHQAIQLQESEITMQQKPPRCVHGLANLHVKLNNIKTSKDRPQPHALRKGHQAKNEQEHYWNLSETQKLIPAIDFGHSWRMSQFLCLNTIKKMDEVVSLDHSWSNIALIVGITANRHY